MSHRGEGGKGEGSSSHDYGTEYSEYDTNSRQTMPRSTLASEYDSHQEPYYPNYTTYTTGMKSSKLTLQDKQKLLGPSY